MKNQTTPAEVRSNGGLCMLDDDEADPVRLWAEIHHLRAALQGPDGYATWQDAAVAERVRRVRAERQTRWLTKEDIDPLIEQARDAFYPADMNPHFERALVWLALRAAGVQELHNAKFTGG